MPLLTVTVVPDPTRVTVRLAGEADLSTRTTLLAALHRAAALGTGPVEVDLGRVRFWDSSGLTLLGAFRADLAASGREVRLVGAPPLTRRLADLAGLGHLLDTALDMDGPLAAAVRTPQDRTREAAVGERRG